MIIKIWPINSAVGIAHAVDYVGNLDKTKAPDVATESIPCGQIRVDESNHSEDIVLPDVGRAFRYMSQEDKIKHRYLSFYMCSADNPARSFRAADEATLAACGTREREGAVAFHIVQSFPDDLDISDEEVHQCGVELVKRLGKYQAIIASHVNPVEDEEGTAHGKCKHNHILINAYIHPEKLDPNHPHQMKYHDCKESYTQLRIHNDEIAIDHGLPIIRETDGGRGQCWTEMEAKRNNSNWKDQVRKDIIDAMNRADGWESYLEEMRSRGYTTRQGKYVTYQTPDKQHRVRGKALGAAYCKTSIQKRWTHTETQCSDPEPSLVQVVEESPEPLFAQIPLGPSHWSHRPTKALDLGRHDLSLRAVDSYFLDTEQYAITTTKGRKLATVSGTQIKRYLADVPKREAALKSKGQIWDGAATRRRKSQDVTDRISKQGFFGFRRYRCTQTGKPYTVPVRDGKHRRSSLELFLLCARAVITGENDNWTPPKPPPKYASDYCYGTTDWKVQNILDSVQIAQEEGLRTPHDIEVRLEQAGAALSRARATVRRTQATLEAMAAVEKSIRDFESLRYMIEDFNHLPEGAEKSRKRKDLAPELERYRQARAVMYRNGVTQYSHIEDFRKRYAQAKKKLQDANQNLDAKKEEYRRLKKLQYHTKCAFSPRYCYGPNYPGLSGREPPLIPTDPYLEPVPPRDALEPTQAVKNRKPMDLDR